MADDASARRELMQDLERCIITDGGGILKNLAETQRQLRQQDLLARLGNMLTDLQGYIDRRAGELAAPHIAEAGRLAGEEVAAARVAQQRAEDLVAEMRRQLVVLEGQNTRYRDRIKQAELYQDACLRALEATKLPDHLDPVAHPVSVAGYQACAERVRTALHLEPG